MWFGARGSWVKIKLIFCLCAVLGLVVIEVNTEQCWTLSTTFWMSCSQYSIIFCCVKKNNLFVYLFVFSGIKKRLWHMYVPTGVFNVMYFLLIFKIRVKLKKKNHDISCACLFSTWISCVLYVQRYSLHCRCWWRQ